MMVDLSLSQNKQTARTHTLAVPGEAGEVSGGCQTHFYFIPRLEALKVAWTRTLSSFFLLSLCFNERGEHLLLNQIGCNLLVYI